MQRILASALEIPGRAGWKHCLHANGLAGNTASTHFLKAWASKTRPQKQGLHADNLKQMVLPTKDIL